MRVRDGGLSVGERATAADSRGCPRPKVGHRNTKTGLMTRLAAGLVGETLYFDHDRRSRSARSERRALARLSPDNTSSDSRMSNFQAREDRCCRYKTGENS